MIEGYRRFLATSWPARQALFQDLAEHGQNPHAMVIACADSRVDPGMILMPRRGNIHGPQCRQRGALRTGWQPARHLRRLEFGVRVLRVTDLVELGHAMCGGVRRAPYRGAAGGAGIPCSLDQRGPRCPGQGAALRGPG
jgi:carbonic anhydrase